MKFAYVAAALLGLAYGNPLVAEAPEADSLAFHEAREIEDVALLEERDDDVALLDAVEEMFSLFEREADAAFDDDFEEEATELESRSAGSILGALKKVNGNAKAVNSKLNKIPKGKKAPTQKALAVKSAADKLAKSVQAATGAANGSKKLNKKDSKKVIGYVNKALKPITLKTLKNFIAHKKAFKKGNFDGIVKNNLQSLQGQVGSLANALISKSGSKKVSAQGRKIAAQINSAFNKAIAAY